MRGVHAAMEMARLWKSQNDSHSRLEISPRTRDSHIPTADPRRVLNTEEAENGNKSVTHVSGLICYRCFRLRTTRPACLYFFLASDRT